MYAHQGRQKQNGEVNRLNLVDAHPNRRQVGRKPSAQKG